MLRVGGRGRFCILDSAVLSPTDSLVDQYQAPTLVLAVEAQAERISHSLVSLHTQESVLASYGSEVAVPVAQREALAAMEVEEWIAV